MQALRAEGASALSAFFLNQFGVLPMKHNLGQGRFGWALLYNSWSSAIALRDSDGWLYILKKFLFALIRGPLFTRILRTLSSLLLQNPGFI